MSGKPTPAMAGFTKIVIKWQPVKGAVSYKVYRDEKMVGTVDKAEYADCGLSAGTAYIYRITAVNADGESPRSAKLEVRTLEKMSGQEGGIIQNVVDQISPNTVTAANLLTTVTNSLKLLKNVNVGLTSIDSGLVKKMIDQEMAIRNEPEPVADHSKETLEQVMKQHYKGHSFLDLYIHSKLTELAESHWQANKKETALILYEKSLSYLPDVEALVFNTLVRIAYINFYHINHKSSPEEIYAALRQYGETMKRYAKFFPNQDDPNHAMVRVLIAQRYAQCFPRMLSYGHFNKKFLETATGLAQKICDINPDACSAYRVTRFNGWKLGKLKVSFYNPAGNPLPGTLTVQNETIGEAGDKFIDERTFHLTDCYVTMPIHIGHNYDLIGSFPVPRGKPLRYKVRLSSPDFGNKTTFNRFKPPVARKLTRTTDPAEAVFIVERPRSPYNIESDINGNTLKLSWDWAAPSDDYQLKEFKVYCDGVEVGTTAKPTLADIKIEAVNVSYAYTVSACDVNGLLSPRSPVVTVLIHPPEPDGPPGGPPPETVKPPEPPKKTAVKSLSKSSSKSSSKSKSRKLNTRAQRNR